VFGNVQVLCNSCNGAKARFDHRTEEELLEMYFAEEN
jgi:hypothetical protein